MSWLATHSPATACWGYVDVANVGYSWAVCSWLQTRTSSATAVFAGGAAVKTAACLLVHNYHSGPSPYACKGWHHAEAAVTAAAGTQAGSGP
jgi:hypothetical protein